MRTRSGASCSRSAHAPLREHEAPGSVLDLRPIGAPRARGPADASQSPGRSASAADGSLGSMPSCETSSSCARQAHGVGAQFRLPCRPQPRRCQESTRASRAPRSIHHGEGQKRSPRLVWRVVPASMNDGPPSLTSNLAKPTTAVSDPTSSPAARRSRCCSAATSSVVDSLSSSPFTITARLFATSRARAAPARTRSRAAVTARAYAQSVERLAITRRSSTARSAAHVAHRRWSSVRMMRSICASHAPLTTTGARDAQQLRFVRIMRIMRSRVPDPAAGRA